MKPTKVLKHESQSLEIDWNTPQWVTAEDDLSFIILTTGEHEEHAFVGTLLPNEDYPNGGYGEDWSKSDFIPLVTPMQIEISN